MAYICRNKFNLRIDMKKGIVLLSTLLILLSSVALGAKKPPKNNKSAVGNSRFSIGIGMEVADYYTPALKKASTFKNPVWFGPRITAWYNPNSSVAIGVDLGSGFRKIRLKISSTNNGKSGGGRVVIHELVIDTN